MALVSGFTRSRTSKTVEAEVHLPPEQARPYLLLGGSGEAARPPGSGQVHAIDDGLIIGRSRPKSGRGIRFLALRDQWVSSAHAQIAKGRNGYDVVDLDSRNGTLVDGRGVKRQALRDGSLLFFGGQAAVFRLVTDEAITALEEERREPLGPVPTTSPAMALALRKLRRLAITADAVLLAGETGTGKEVYARAIHGASGRKGRFVGLNCAAVPAELVESELFGYARGAHSQASQAKRGLIEEAEGGTLFLDELGDMPRSAQAKLLRFLQEREVMPLGSGRVRRVDVRVIAATAHLEDDVGRPTLRRDLLMRLGTEPIVLPPLRHRPEDIGVLAHHGLEGRATFDNRAFLALCLHDWPGNVRELLKVVRDAALFREAGKPIGLEHLPPTFIQRFTQPPVEGRPRRRPPRPAPERDELERLLQHHQGNVADLARQLDRRWSVVWRWLKRHDLDPERFRG
jgi:transcriptional regulator with PAS, ATPase and Fis domain